MEDFKENESEASIGDLIYKIKTIYKYLISKWLYIFIGSFICAAIGFIYASLKKPIYTAECTFVIEEGGGGGGLGQYAGIASMVGIDIGSSSSNGLFQGDNIMELYKSRTILKQTLLSPVLFDGKRQLLIDHYISFNKLREGWDENPVLKGINFSESKSQFSQVQDSLIFGIIKEIKSNYLTVSRLDKKTSIISVKMISKDELFAKLFVTTLVENVNSFYTRYKTKKSTDNLIVLRNQDDSVRRVLISSMGSVANAVDANPKPNLSRQILRVPSQRRQIDVQANSAIYAEIEKNLFITRMSLMNEKPLIQVIDKPEFPLDKSSRGRLKAMILGGIMGGILTLITVSIIDLFRRYN